MKIMRMAVVAALVGLAGIATSRAQTTNVTGVVNISLKGKLAPSGATVSNESLSGNTNNLAVLITDQGILIGQYAVVSGVTNVSTAYLSDTSSVTVGHNSVDVFTGTPGATSNALWLVTLSSSKAKISGIWIDGSNAVTASISPKK